MSDTDTPKSKAQKLVAAANAFADSELSKLTKQAESGELDGDAVKKLETALAPAVTTSAVATKIADATTALAGAPTTELPATTKAKLVEKLKEMLAILEA